MSQSINTSKYRTLSDKEFISMIADKRYLSPIINELCYRLSCKPEARLSFNLDCPVCEAEIIYRED